MIRHFTPLTSGYIPLHVACLGLRGKDQFQHPKADSVRLLIESFQIPLRDDCQKNMVKKTRLSPVLYNNRLFCPQIDLSIHTHLYFSVVLLVPP